MTDDRLRTIAGAQVEAGIFATRAAVGRLLRRYSSSPVQSSEQEALPWLDWQGCLDTTLALSGPSDARLPMPRSERPSSARPTSPSLQLPRALRKRFSRERFRVPQPDPEEELAWLQWRECLESTLAAAAPTTDATASGDVPVPVVDSASLGGLFARLFARREPAPAQPLPRPSTAPPPPPPLLQPPPSPPPPPTLMPATTPLPPPVDPPPTPAPPHVSTTGAVVKTTPPRSTVVSELLGQDIFQVI